MRAAYAHAVGAGYRFYSYGDASLIGRDDAEVDERLAGIKDRFLQAGVSEDRAEQQVQGLRTQPAVGTPEQIAEMTALAADAVREFGLTPKAALLSHSNFGASRSASARKMQRALGLWLE